VCCALNWNHVFEIDVGGEKIKHKERNSKDQYSNQYFFDVIH